MPKSLRVILKKKHFEGKLTDQDYKEIIDKLDGHDAELIKYHVNYDKVFNFVNDLRLAISPDELTPKEKRPKKLAQVEILDRVLDYMIEITR